jgi:hypothetical protein
LLPAIGVRRSTIPWREEIAMRWPAIPAVLLALLLSGCHDDFSYSVSINTTADSGTVTTGEAVGLSVHFTTDNTDVDIDHDDWQVVSSPGAYTLADLGRSADLTPSAAGIYVVRYRVWYWTDWGDYNYQESFVTVEAVSAFAG